MSKNTREISSIKLSHESYYTRMNGWKKIEFHVVKHKTQYISMECIGQGRYITLGIDISPMILVIISLAHRIYCIGPRRLLLFQLIFSIALLRKSFLVFLLGKQTMHVLAMHSRTCGTN